MTGNQETNQDASMVSGLNDSISKLRNALFHHLGLSNLPEFGGSPKENIETFLRAFERATATIPDDQKCLALKRSLTGDADLFAKNYLQEVLNEGDWERAKADLRHRFLQEDLAMLYRLELSRMKYDPSQSTLLSYVDKYANIYRNIHPSAGNREIIEDLSIHLDKDIIRNLNQLSEDWKQSEDFEDFRKLIRRLERDILSLNTEKRGSTQEILQAVNQYVSAAIEKPMKEMREFLVTNKKETNEPEDKLAAIKNSTYPEGPNLRRYRQEPKRKERDWERPQLQTYRQDLDHVRIPTWIRQLRKNYEDMFGEIKTNCILCDGHHWKRHCPLQTYNLKELRNHS